MGSLDRELRALYVVGVAVPEADRRKAHLHLQTSGLDCSVDPTTAAVLRIPVPFRPVTHALLVPRHMRKKLSCPEAVESR